MINVLFICHGNICRSPMAEFIFKDMVEKRGLADNFTIESCATSTEEIGRSLHPGARAKLDQMGIPHQRRRARRLTKKDYEDFDYLLCMDEWNVRNTRRIIRKDPDDKVHMLLEYAGQRREIADPWYTDNFDETYDDLILGCEAFLQYLKENRQLSF
ncbi:MAG: low molecular weight phosphotyrosine protein phosphatase [Clostridiales bacterium]|nr:low molecular weight phosphotyrosine protein phosphatase [Clostridiales bacterium]